MGSGACALGLAVALAQAAPAAAERARVSAHFPVVVTAGSWVRVRGQVAGARRPVRVAVEQRVGAHWVVRGSGRSSRGRFLVRWRAPGRREVVRVHLVALRSGRVIALTRVARVAVSATSILAPSRVADAPAPGTAGTVRYSGRAPVRAGEFVAADVGAQTPAGLLGRVVSERSEGADTVLDIVPASLIEAVPEGRIDLAPVAGAAHAAAAARRGFRSAFSCTGAVQAGLHGSVAIKLRPAFKLDWSWGEVTSAEAKVTVRGDAELSARIEAAASCTLAQTSVASWDAPPLRAAVGPIPVVIVPRTTLYVSGEAQVDAAVEAGLHGYMSATAGLRYDGDVYPIGGFEHGLSATPPAAHLDGSLGARVIPSVTFLLYGQAGPRFDLSAGLQLDAGASSDPWWTLTAPVELSAGLAVPGFDSLEIPQRPVFSKTFPVAEADPSPDKEPPPDGDADGLGAERVRIGWDTAATDVDLHVWDEHGNHAWYMNPGGVPGGELSDDDRHGFGPELFFDRTAGGRGLTYGLCYFDDSGVGATSVSVRLTDPAGAVRESAQTLAHEGDHVLIGSGFVPSGDWCRP